jgi:hypothetical protein
VTHLVSVGHEGAVVCGVQQAIIVDVRVTGVAQAVIVRVCLVVGRVWAHVARVAVQVAVCVGLPRKRVQAGQGERRRGSRVACTVQRQAPCVRTWSTLTSYGQLSIVFVMPSLGWGHGETGDPSA